MKSKKVNSFLKKNIVIICILLLAFLLRVYQLESQMMFIGDFAWFYLSARDLLLTHSIPLVGITSSQTWLHQGPLWTYMLAIVLKLFSYSPLSGGYLAVGIGVLSVAVVYQTGLELFSKKVGLICAFLFATSPLIIVFSRMPYHTSPIPLFITLLLLYTYRWLKKGPQYFPYVLLFCAILYNFELATFSVVPVVGGFFLYGFIKKRKYTEFYKSKKTIFYSVIAIIVPMFPILIYDFKNGFLQTIKFVHWTIFLRILKPIIEGSNSNIDFAKSLSFFFKEFQRTIFLDNAPISLLILTLVVCVIGYRIIKRRIFTLQEQVVLLYFCIPFFAFFLNGTLSEAYIPVLFPTVLIIISFYLLTFFNTFKKEKILFISVFLLGLINVQSIIKNNYFMGQPGGYGVPFSTRAEAAWKIISLSNYSKVAIVPGNGGNGYESFIMPYEYLVWLYGGGVSQDGDPVSVSETGNSILIRKENKTYEIIK